MPNPNCSGRKTNASGSRSAYETSDLLEVPLGYPLI